LTISKRYYQRVNEKPYKKNCSMMVQMNKEELIEIISHMEKYAPLFRESDMYNLVGERNWNIYQTPFCRKKRSVERMAEKISRGLHNCDYTYMTRKVNVMERLKKKLEKKQSIVK